jgi:quinoprotein glucose dehydrogenase
MNLKVVRVLLVAATCAAQSAPKSQSAPRLQPAGDNWYSYGGDSGGSHYSTLKQITKANVGQLKEAWRYTTPDAGSTEATPLIVNGVMYVVTPKQGIVALDAGTGKQKWAFDSGVGVNAATRGLAYWTDGKEGRLFIAVASFLYGVNAADGTVLKDFGEGGRIDLRKDLDDTPPDITYSLSSPAVIYKDLLIIGGRVSENTPSAPGDERAFDVHTGKLRWTFHTIPKKDEPGAETWPAGVREALMGGANAWAGNIVDTTRGIVFLATGSAGDDFYGVNRTGNNLYANSVIALDANTGKMKWYFQATHHDLWDSDFAAPPALLTVKSGGKMVDAVVATNKFGFVYIFDRVTGKPLFPIVETPVPASTVAGEHASPTQPIPMLPHPLAKQTLARDEVTNRTPEMHAWAQKQWDTFLGTQQPFTPLSVDKDTLISPGWKGGVEWGGISTDPAHGIMYANVNNVYSLGTLTDAAAYRQAGVGERAYRQNCQTCHGAERQGAPPAIPSLVDVGKKLSAEDIATTIQKGRGGMPGFTNMQGGALANLIAYLTTGKDDPNAPAQQRGGGGGQQRVAGPQGMEPNKYIFTGYRYFNDPEGYNAGGYPWGTLSAIDMNTGQYLWTVPYGEHTELAAKGLTGTGAGSHGGTVMTGSGVLFTGGSEYDTKLRAYDSASGKVLWTGDLPGHGAATPATYAVNGKQYVVIAASPARGGRAAASGSPAGAIYVVFALP